MSELSTDHRLLIQARMIISILAGDKNESAKVLVQTIDRHLMGQMPLRDFIDAFHQASPSDGFSHDGCPKKPEGFSWMNAAAIAARNFAFQYAKPMED